MAVTRWNPWGELFTLSDTLEQMFGRAALPERSMFSTSHLPLDVRQTDTAYIIEASLPGFSPEEVDITLDENILTIRAQRSEESEDSKSGYVRRERRGGSFYRQVGLPAEVRGEEIAAAFDNGVLTVTVPRAQKAQPRRIAVSPSSGQPTIVEGAAEKRA